MPVNGDQSVDLGTRLRRWTKAALLVFGLVASGAVPAQQTQVLNVEDALRVKSFGDYSSCEFSPDGRWLAIVVRDRGNISTRTLESWTKLGVPSWSAGSEIRVVSLATGTSTVVTKGVGAGWSPSWSPNGAYLAFLSSGGEEQAHLWTWEVATNQAKKASDIAIRGIQMQWMEDSRRVLLTVLPKERDPSEYAPEPPEGGDAKLRGSEDSTVRVYRAHAVSNPKETPSPADPWNLDRSLRDLAIVNIVNGQVQIVAHGNRIATFRLAPDHSHVAFTIPKRFAMPGSQQILFDLVAVDLERKATRVVASDLRLDYDGGQFAWSPDSRLLSFRSAETEEQRRDYFVADLAKELIRNVSSLPAAKTSARPRGVIPLWDRQAHLYFVYDGALWRASATGTKAAEVARIPHRQVTHLIQDSAGLLWNPEGGNSTVLMTHDDSEEQDGLYKVALDTGTTKSLVEGHECYTCENVSEEQLTTVLPGDAAVAYFAQDGAHPGDLWSLDIPSQKTRKLTRLNPQLEQYASSSPQMIRWLSDDGEELRGALLPPADYKTGTRYPLVVYVYGGSRLSEDINRFGLADGGPFNMQLLASRGFAVLLPDSPLHLGTPMADIAKTILPGINKAVEIGLADPSRIGVMGVSNGGYTTLALITQTKRFRAAIEVSGTSDLIGHYGQMDQSGTSFGTSLERGYDALGGSPWEYRDRYVENSPFFYLDRVETPLLIVHGSSDPIVSAFLGDQIFVALRRLGKEVEFARYDGEEHSAPNWRYTNQVDLTTRMLQWLDRFLKDR